MRALSGVVGWREDVLVAKPDIVVASLFDTSARRASS